MLVLTRKVGQQIVIDNNIVITVLRVGKFTVRLGIEAPDGVRILRHELTVVCPADDDSPVQQPGPLADHIRRRKKTA